MMRKFIILLVLLSGTAWAESTNPPLSPPKLIPATDHDPEHLSMFVTQFFRWWVDHGIRDYYAGYSTTDGKEIFNKRNQIKERESLDQEKKDTLQKALTPVLWSRYKNSEGELDTLDLIFPLGDSNDSWRDTAFSQIVTLQNQTATFIVSLPSSNVYEPPNDKPFQFRILLQTYQGTWRIGEVRDVSPEGARF